MTHLPKFSAALLHPRYWLLWLGIGLLWLVVQLPYPVIYRLGNAIGRLAMRFMKRRAKIAYRNLELCFPEKSEQERHQLVVQNFESVGMGLMKPGWHGSGQPDALRAGQTPSALNMSATCRHKTAVSC